ncbi:MAG: histone deacetylase [Candidatus Sumerlaeota bacterium]|nr:histone deacetylase [Candidatus Sumerlaeota bacterium]
MTSHIVFVYSPKYEVDIGEHPFKTTKYRLTAERLVAECGVARDQLLEPSPPDEATLLRALDREYLEDMKALRWNSRTASSELPISRAIIDGSFLCAGGTLLAARKALELGGIGFHVGGGWHHAFRDHAEGFCYVNDIAAAILTLQAEGAIKRAIVVDCDLHQGNGTAVYFQTDPDVFTFSIHQERLYPQKEKSDLDIGLDDFTGDLKYLAALGSAIPRLYDSHKPQIVFYVAGADPYKDDLLGNLQLTKEGLRKRDELVIRSASERRLPVVVMLAGGYSPDVRDTVDIHLATARVALECAGQ